MRGSLAPGRRCVEPRGCAAEATRQRGQPRATRASPGRLTKTTTLARSASLMWLESPEPQAQVPHGPSCEPGAGPLASCRNEARLGNQPKLYCDDAVCNFDEDDVYIAKIEDVAKFSMALDILWTSSMTATVSQTIDSSCKWHGFTVQLACCTIMFHIIIGRLHK